MEPNLHAPELMRQTQRLFAQFQARDMREVFPDHDLWRFARSFHANPPKPVRGSNLSFSADFLTPKIFNGIKTWSIRPLFKKEKDQDGTINYIQYKSRFTINEGTQLHLFFQQRRPNGYLIGDAKALGLPPLIAFDDFTEDIAFCDGFRAFSNYSTLEAMQYWFQELYGKEWAQEQPYVIIAWTPIWNTVEEPFGQTFNPRKKKGLEAWFT